MIRCPCPTAYALLLLLVSCLAPNHALAQFADCVPAQNGWSECIIDGSDNIDSCGGGSGADGVSLADVDGDGDLDAMTGWEETDNSFIYFNPTIGARDATNAITCPGQWPLVDATGGYATKDVEDAIFADIDRDGEIDSMVSSNEGSRRDVGLHVLRPGLMPHLASSWEGEELPGEGNYYMQAAVGLIRPFYGNGDVKTCNDIVVGAKGSEKEVEGSVEFGGLKIGYDVSTCDIDPITELPLIPDNCFHGGIWWWECPKDSEGGPFRGLSEFPDFDLKTGKWEKRKIHDAFWVMSLELVDMDGDGDLDVLFDDRRKVGWFENRTSSGQGGNLSGWGNPIEIEHMDQLEPWSVDSTGKKYKFPSGGPYRFLTRADLDGDGLEDVISTVNFDPRTETIGKLAAGRWYRRLDSTGENWSRHWIFPTDPVFYEPDTNPNAMGLPYHGDHDGKTVSKAVAVADLDEDGSLDLVFAVRGSGSGMYVLTQKPDSLTTGLWNTYKIATEGDDYKFDNIQIADIDGDNDLDIVTTDENFGEGSLGLGTLYYANPLRQANRPPTARCRGLLLEANAQCGPQNASINFQSSDVDGDPLSFEQAPAGPYPLGSTQVTLTALDPAGFFDSCQATVTHVDRSAPALTCPSGVVQRQCASPEGTTVNYQVSTDDNCDAAPSLSCSVASGSVLPLGATTSVCESSDAAGNEGSCNVQLSVVDTLKPVVTAPADVSAECVSAAGTQVSLGSATATDQCVGALTPVSDAPAAFLFGPTTVEWRADDGNGNVGKAFQQVTITDTVDPVVSCPGNMTRECTGNYQAVVGFAATASDACSSGLAASCLPASNSAFGLGGTTVNCSATDVGGNTDACSFGVTVEDTQAPSITCPENIDITTAPGQCSAGQGFSLLAGDICDPAPAVSCVDQNGASVSPAAHTYPVGTTTVTCTVTDSASLSSQCAFDVTVNDPPVLSVVPTAQTVQYSDLVQAVSIAATQCGPQDLVLATGPIPAGLTLSAASCADRAGGGRECAWTLDGPMGAPAGDYVVDMTASDGALTSAVAQTRFEVLSEDASLLFAETNDAAVQVASEGGVSGSFALDVSVLEALPDAAAAGAARAGDIGLAEVTVQLMPLAPGAPVAGSCVSNGVNGAGYDAVQSATCSFDGVPVNLYTVAVHIGGYYLGSGEDLLTVFDPTLGFTSGGAQLTWPGSDDHTNVSYQMNFDKQSAGMKGNFLLMRHAGEGQGYRLKADAIDGVSVGTTADFGWAAFTGKTTYQEPGMDEAGDAYEFIVYVEDRGTPGKDADRFWIEVRDGDGNVMQSVSIAGRALDNAIPIEGGNIQAPLKAPR